MSTATTTDPPMTQESKSSKKKRAKADNHGKTSSVTSATPVGDATNSVVTTEGLNGHASKDDESPQLRELQKSIRNLNKKLNAMAKVDAIIAEHPDMSLDDLVATRKINPDQKMQAVKKPSLQATLAQLEDQAAQYRKFEQDYQSRYNEEKRHLRASHEAELEKVRSTVKNEALANARLEAKSNLLLLSRFLRLAAAKRQEVDPNPDSTERKALEGLLLMVYGGDEAAVTAAEKLLQGSHQQVMSTAQEPVEWTYAQIKQAALEDEQDQNASEPLANEAEPSSSHATTATADGHGPSEVQTDQTLAHARLTEMDDASSTVNRDDVADPDEASLVIPQSSIDTAAANETADTRWDNKMSASAEGAEEWVTVPRDPAETDVGVVATPASPAALVSGGVQSWADDAPDVLAPSSSGEPPVPATASADRQDDFHEVHRSRGGRGARHGGSGGLGEHRGGGYRGRGGYRGGTGDGPGYRGYGGYRGDRGAEGGYRGRGRGGPRGGFGGRGRDRDG